LSISEGNILGKAKKAPITGSFPSKCEYILFNDVLLVCGGHNQDHSFSADTFEIPVTQHPLKAEQKEPLPIGRTGHSLVQVEDSVYAIGGITVELHDNVDIYKGGSWTPGPALIESLKEPASVYIKETKILYAFGGRATHGLTASITYLNIGSGASEWDSMGEHSISLQGQNHMYMAVPYQDGVLLFGGFLNQACYHFNLTTQETKPVPDLKFPDQNRIKTSTIYTKGESICAFGTNDGQLYAFDKGKWTAIPSLVWCGETFNPDAQSTFIG
jgi:hypothetical protein